MTEPLPNDDQKDLQTPAGQSRVLGTYTVQLGDLMPKGLRRMAIEHGQQLYFLSITQSGKLILTK